MNTYACTIISTMAHTQEKGTTLNFRVSEDVAEMLRQLAEGAGLTMTDFVVTFVRATYKHKFPDKAHAYETPAERFEQEILSLGETRRQDRYRADLDKALREEVAGHGPLVAPLVHASKGRKRFDEVMGPVRRVLAVEAEWMALKAVRQFEQQASRQTEAAAIKAVIALAAFYDDQVREREAGAVGTKRGGQ